MNPSSMNTNAGGLASQIAYLFRELHPDDALECESFWEALQGFVGRSSDNFRMKLSTCFELENLPRKQPPAKRRKTNEPSSDRALTFFRGKQGALRKKSPRSFENMISGVEVLRSGCAGASKISEDLNNMLQNPDSSRVPTRQSIGSRQKRVVEKHNSSESLSDIVEVDRRLNLLFVEYEVRRLSLSLSLTIDDSVAKLSEQAEVSADQINTMRRNVRPYLNLICQDNGLGYLLMLGSQGRKLWERDLSNIGIDLILEFCQNELPEVVETAKNLQTLACHLVERGFIDYGADPAELRQQNHIFSRHFEYLDTNSSLQPPSDSGTADADHTQESQADTEHTSEHHTAAQPCCSSPKQMGIRGVSDSNVEMLLDDNLTAWAQKDYLDLIADVFGGEVGGVEWM